MARNRKDKFQVGDRVRHKTYGEGFLHQVDPGDFEFHYDFHFADGTLIWMSKPNAERWVKLVHRPQTPPAVETRPNGVLRLFED